MAVSTQVMDFFMDAPTFLESKTKNNPNGSDSKTDLQKKKKKKMAVPNHKSTPPLV